LALDVEVDNVFEVGQERPQMLLDGTFNVPASGKNHMIHKFLTNLPIKVPHNVIDKKLQIASMYVANKNYHTWSYKILIAPNTCFQSMKFSKRHHFLLNEPKLNCLLVAALASPSSNLQRKIKTLILTTPVPGREERTVDRRPEPK
jgi:hypothetical protein